MIECRDVMTLCLPKLEEETKQEILDKPDSCQIPIAHDGTTLDLDQASSVVEVDCDRCGHAIGVAESEPENSVELNPSVVNTGFNVLLYLF